MYRIFKSGEEVKGYSAPVLNEREVRAAAGILFLATFISFMFIMFSENFVPFKYVITFFLTDFIFRVFLNPKYSPTLILGRLIVGNQEPEYVSAAPKKFAWSIGLAMSLVMFMYFIVYNTISPVTGILCLLCMIFLFFETAFGICLGCLFYPLLFRKKEQYCPGRVCVVKVKQDIQKTSSAQYLVLLLFVFSIIYTSYSLKGIFSKPPENLSTPVNNEKAM